MDTLKSDYKWLAERRLMIAGMKVLELGCGTGSDTGVICQIAKFVVACDIDPPSELADKFNVAGVDHSKPLPFKSREFDVVLASLSLHYFDWENTHQIISEISRVLIDRGVLICRVNSREDSNYGAIGHPEIESGLYNVRGVAKRFFSNDDIGNLFANGWTVRDLQLKTIDRYDLPKCIWEFTAIND